jgi:hypothetical protein
MYDYPLPGLRTNTHRLEWTASISLGVGINIKGVVSTDFNITIASDSTKEESKSETYELSHTWEMKYVHMQGAA